jgi:hypothetical protein
MMEAWARIVPYGGEIPVPTMRGFHPTVERDKLEFEKWKFEKETKR